MIDDTQFEQEPEQVFEDAEQQQQFEEGKWPLIVLIVPNNSQIIHIYFIACMSLWYDGDPIKDMPSLLYLSLIKLGLLYLCWVALLVAYT